MGSFFLEHLETNLLSVERSLARLAFEALCVGRVYSVFIWLAWFIAAPKETLESHLLK